MLRYCPGDLLKGSSIKYVRSDCVVLDTPPLCTCTYPFNLHPLSLVRVYGYDFYGRDGNE